MTQDVGYKHIKGIYEGLPYEGPPLNLKNDDPPTMRPRRVHTVETQIFSLNDVEDLRLYTAVMDRVAKGWCHISSEEREWVPRLETWKIFLRTISFKYIEPEDTERVIG